MEDGNDENRSSSEKKETKRGRQPTRNYILNKRRDKGTEKRGRLGGMWKGVKLIERHKGT